MPLDFTQPRAEPTLGRRHREDLVALSRSKYPVTDIVAGLRAMGGPWTQRDPGEQQRIDRYRRDIEAMERRPEEPPGWKYPTAKELVALTNDVLSRMEVTYERQVRPCRIQTFSDNENQQMVIRMIDESPTGTVRTCQQSITMEELRRYNVDAISVVDTCVNHMYAKLQRDAVPRTPSMTVKPVDH